MAAEISAQDLEALVIFTYGRPASPLPALDITQAGNQNKDLVDALLGYTKPQPGQTHRGTTDSITI